MPERIWSSVDVCWKDGAYLKAGQRFATLRHALRRQKQLPKGKGHLVVTNEIEAPIRLALEKQNGSHLHWLELHSNTQLNDEKLVDLRPGNYVLRWPEVSGYEFLGCDAHLQLASGQSVDGETSERDRLQRLCRFRIQSYKVVGLTGTYKRN